MGEWRILDHFVMEIEKTDEENIKGQLFLETMPELHSEDGCSLFIYYEEEEGVHC